MICENCAMNVESENIPFPTSVVGKQEVETEAVDVEVDVLVTLGCELYVQIFDPFESRRDELIEGLIDSTKVTECVDVEATEEEEVLGFA